MLVRTAKLSDINSVMKIESAGFIPEIQEEEAVFLKRIKLCPQLFLIFEQNGKTAGYLSAEYMNHIPETAEELSLGHIPAPDVSKNYIYISSFSILPEYRGNGNGKICWNMALDYLGRDNKFILLVNEAWQGAKHIYLQSGFKELKSFKDFFPAEANSFTAGTLMIRE